MTPDFCWGMVVGGGLTLFFVILWSILRQASKPQHSDPEDPADWWKKN